MISIGSFNVQDNVDTMWTHAVFYSVLYKNKGHLPSGKCPNFVAIAYLFNACWTATAQATVAPTIGLLPMPMKPIIST